MHTTGYYSSVNKNDIMKFVSKWHIIGLTQCWTLNTAVSTARQDRPTGTTVTQMLSHNQALLDWI